MATDQEWKELELAERGKQVEERPARLAAEVAHGHAKRAALEAAVAYLESALHGNKVELWVTEQFREDWVRAVHGERAAAARVLELGGPLYRGKAEDWRQPKLDLAQFTTGA